MVYVSKSIEVLVIEFSKLPGIGRKTAQRLAYYIQKLPRNEVVLLAKTLVSTKDNVKNCSICHNLTDNDPCSICDNLKRDRSIICVVEEPNDVQALERTGEFSGVYHVLGGTISPLQGVGPDDLKIRELLNRLGDEVKEVVLATNPNVEGDATSIYLAKLLKPRGVKVTRIARGLPIGGDLEYADEMTLTRALEGRTVVD